MKLKYYLRGLGIGIICTAIIMGIALSGNKKETLTDAEIIERARLLGMVMEEETGETKKAGSSEGKNPINEKKEDGQNKKKNSSDYDEIKDTMEEEDKKEQEESPEKTKKEQEEKSLDENEVQSEGNEGSVPETVQIEIKTGEYSDVISRKLFQAGLVPDAEAFNQYLTQKGADDSLRVGVYQIPTGATQDEIIQILQEKE